MRSLSFYHLPLDEHDRHLWLISIKKEITVSAHTRICSLHFVGGKKSKEYPVPTLFPWSKPQAPKRKAPPERHTPIKVTRLELSDTELSDTECEKEKKIKQLQEEVEQLKRTRVERFGLRRFMGSDNDIRFYTGLPTYKILLCLFNFIAPLLSHLHLLRTDRKHTTMPTTHAHTPRPRALQPIDELFMVLVRLRLASPEQDLAHRFDISMSTVSRICKTWILFLDQQLRPLITWPTRSSINEHMPSQFKQLYPQTRCIIDCTEIFCESPSALDIQSVTYSHYKHHNTFKGLIAISPSGAVIFISHLYGGSVSDKAITRLSGLFRFLEVGDSVMADKGFDIVYDLMCIGVKLNIPPKLTRVNKQMPKSHVITTRKIASLRIHVERAIQRIKVYRILSFVVPLSMSPIVEHIWGVCCALSLFHPPLVIDTPCTNTNEE